jgi:hypothetical protein
MGDGVAVTQVYWQLTTADGSSVDEGQVLWPGLPRDIVIAALRVGDDLFTGFQSYGFHRYTVSVPGRGAVGRGFQVFGETAGGVIVVTDVDEISGRHEVRCLEAGAVTYAKELMRRGR